MTSYPLNNDEMAGGHPLAKTEQHLIEQLDDALAANLLTLNSEALENLLGWTFVLRLPNGNLISKLELFDLIATGELIYKAFQIVERSVRFSDGKMAFVNGSCMFDVEYMGKIIKGHFRYTALYVSHNELWQAVALFQHDGFQIV